MMLLAGQQRAMMTCLPWAMRCAAMLQLLGVVVVAVGLSLLLLQVLAAGLLRCVAAAPPSWLPAAPAWPGCQLPWQPASAQQAAAWRLLLLQS
jgi:hypothetical protein